MSPIMLKNPEALPRSRKSRPPKANLHRQNLQRLLLQRLLRILRIPRIPRTPSIPRIPAKNPVTRKTDYSRAEKIYSRLEAAYPDAKCALDFTTPLQLLIATILSAQSTDKTV